ncbi:tetratricopeptide repeat protein [Varunaivibrio sulfuroxidans]|uniref:tetratricopeptide repeat protein n=1 Tax=Varunaivibrio sulfuroxidans TaxID=1773489 RepID=UPI00140475C0|nr:tetratricopeptide repeat protein [Varunaivibrio sulfuroxidans]WES29929.1 tetratricopeptide repeat protein [Varunaivibrio sulfuroxidans]
MRKLTPLADGGNPLAQFELGLIYKSGLYGVPKDPERGFAYLLKAAKQGQWNSQYIVAVMYEQGRGVPENRLAALKWASIAAGRGSRTGMTIAKRLRSVLPRAMVKKAERMADKWTPATLVDGRPPAQYTVNCTMLRVQLDEAEDFLKSIKTEADARRLASPSGAARWSSLILVYPSGTVALSDISRRYRGLLDIKAAKGCR